MGDWAEADLEPLKVFLKSEAKLGNFTPDPSVPW
jgi:hypothetical protein